MLLKPKATGPAFFLPSPWCMAVIATPRAIEESVAVIFDARLGAQCYSGWLRVSHTLPILPRANGGKKLLIITERVEVINVARTSKFES